MNSVAQVRQAFSGGRVTALAVWIAAATACFSMVVATASSLVARRDVDRRARGLVQRAVADDAAWALAARYGEQLRWHGEVVLREGPFEAAAWADFAKSHCMYIEVRERGVPAHTRFRTTVLPGAAPRELGYPLTHWQRGVAHQWLKSEDIEELPRRLTDSVFTSGRRAVHDLSLDREVALASIPVGTDAPDYALSSCSGNDMAFLPPGAEGRVFLIRGNLWIGEGDRSPVHVRLRSSTTIVVDGNIYFRGGVRISGEGHLTLVARSVPGSRYIDEDRDGTFDPEIDSALDHGPYRGRSEGSGSIWLGAPTGHAIASLIEAILVADQDILAPFADTDIELAAATVYGGVISPAELEPRLIHSGRRLPDPTRELLPGFAVEGDPRPAQLRTDYVPGRAR